MTIPTFHFHFHFSSRYMIAIATLLSPFPSFPFPFPFAFPLPELLHSFVRNTLPLSRDRTTVWFATPVVARFSTKNVSIVHYHFMTMSLRVESNTDSCLSLFSPQNRGLNAFACSASSATRSRPRTPLARRRIFSSASPT